MQWATARAPPDAQVVAADAPRLSSSCSAAVTWCAEDCGAAEHECFADDERGRCHHVRVIVR